MNVPPGVGGKAPQGYKNYHSCSRQMTTASRSSALLLLLCWSSSGSVADQQQQQGAALFQEPLTPRENWWAPTPTGAPMTFFEPSPGFAVIEDDVASAVPVLEAQRRGGRRGSRDENSTFQAQAAILFMASRIMQVGDDARSERKSLDMAQAQLNGGKRNRGHVAAMGGFTIDPAMYDVGCEGAMPVKCSPNLRYRTITGICNNLQHSMWGSTSSRLERFVPPCYADGRGEPRGTRSQEECDDINPSRDNNCERCFTDPRALLPNARRISTIFHKSLDRLRVEDNVLSHMVANFGQFVDHEFALSPEAETEVENCCHVNKDENCFPIMLPKDEKIIEGNCMDFKRSSPFCNDTLSVREQTNALTAFVDASNVYGSTPGDSINLREFRDGKLKVSVGPDGKEFLPILSENDRNDTAGDVRANEQPGLNAIHVIFLREHNRMADEIRRLRPELDDEQIYQFARHVMGAQMQNIVFGQFLPLILGDRTMIHFKLYPDPRTDYYCADTNPSMRNAFTGAAFRFGHSLIQGRFRLFSTDLSHETGSFLLRDTFFSASFRERAGEILAGMMMQPSQSFDKFVTDDLHDHLFGNLNGGIDLIARNIQRGRDHGLPGYNEFREFCGMERFCNFSVAPEEIEMGPWRRLAEFYDSPADIDLFTAGLLERPFAGGRLGRTFNCLVAKQFQALKFGDRFFFTLQDHKVAASFRFSTGPIRFNVKKLRNIMRRGLSDLICDNFDLQNVRRNALRMDSDIVSCRQRNRLDMRLLLEDIY